MNNDVNTPISIRLTQYILYMLRVIKSQQLHVPIEYLEEAIMYNAFAHYVSSSNIV